MDLASTRRRAVLGASVGTLLEYYDYYLFGLAAAVVFPKTFFPSSDPVASELASFATFAVGFVLRPLGGIVLGHIADRAGRKTALIITIVSMGIATMLIGVLPGYDQIGVAAPICLVLLRLVQGFATGGEMGSATSLAIEHAPPDRRGLYGALLLSGSGVALFLSSGLMDLVSLLPDGQFRSWGWRIPFLLSVVLLVAGLVIRWKVPETPEFERARKAERPRRAPLLVVLRRPKMLVFGILFGFANSIGGYVVTTYGTAYLTGRGVSASVAYTATMVAAGVQIVLAPTWGALSDRIGRRPVFLGGCAALAVLIFPVFWLYNTENAVLAAVAMVLGFPVAVLAMSALSQTILSELFGTEARATGISMGYQFTAVLAGGFAPAISTALVAAGGGQAWGVCLYVIGACVLSGLSMLMLPDRAGQELGAK
ncbi:MFS transporter [Amycolatopsis sp. CA-230715]|uniref:MFS transporter n=1 Tax=Amycolatopsis sp. CA-230715 TaxID=2745196 RepID=UPI001C00B1BB|nr:MFS transporter [Amycolatopsis sp. CA-230715]QWF82641.1 Inner membrane metabolite transport protein YhjE [Amycolatopsis sp. CA-230715]